MTFLEANLLKLISDGEIWDLWQSFW